MDEKKIKKRLSLLMSFLMLLSTLATTLATPTLAAPTDISNHWAKASIEKLIDYGIMQGNGQGKFSPDSLITRAECVGKDYNTWVNVVVTKPGREMRRYRLNIYRADNQ